MKLLSRPSKSASSIKPIEEHPAYQAVQEVVDRLKGERDTVAADKTDLINRANAYRRPAVEVLSAAYLRGPRPSLDEDGIVINKKIGELSLRFNALTLAIETAEKEVTTVRHRFGRRPRQRRSGRRRREDALESDR